MSRERDERMWQTAHKLAQSGKYTGWWDIEVELQSLGYRRARQLLDDESIRERLNKMCSEARANA